MGLMIPVAVSELNPFSLLKNYKMGASDGGQLVYVERNRLNSCQLIERRDAVEGGELFGGRSRAETGEQSDGGGRND